MSSQLTWEFSNPPLSSSTRSNNSSIRSGNRRELEACCRKVCTSSCILSRILRYDPNANANTAHKSNHSTSQIPPFSFHKRAGTGASGTPPNAHLYVRNSCIYALYPARNRLLRLELARLADRIDRTARADRFEETCDFKRHDRALAPLSFPFLSLHFFSLPFVSFRFWQLLALAGQPTLRFL